MDQELEVTINDLPDEIILKVFYYLDFQSLMNSFLVCRQWNDTMGNSFEIMKRIKLNIYPQSIYKFKRNYQTNKISWVDQNWNTIWQSMSRSHLRDLEIYYCRMGLRDVLSLNETLKSLTKLETLSIIGWIINSCTYNVDLSHLHRLKSLVLDYTDCGILKFPETAQLTSLKARHSASSEELIDFLSRQRSLEELKIDDIYANPPNAFEKLNEIQFPLKKLVFHYGGELFDSEENLLLFINKFVNSLEELEIRRYFPASLYEMIFKKFHKLHTLNIVMDALPKDSAFYQNLTPNLAVRKLIVYNYTENYLETEKIEQHQRFIDSLPNIQTLILNFGFPLSKILMFISQKLENLQINYTFSGPRINTIFPNLKTLTIMNIFEDTKIEGYWMPITNAFPNIGVLKVVSCKSLELLDATNIEIIARGWPRLKRIKLGKRFKASSETLEPFLRNCQHLKTVEISWISSEEKEALRDFLGDRIRLIIHPKEAEELFVNKNKMFDECYSEKN